ncbi:MAG: uroporphyrinogen decarboxylase [Bacteroidota bacterium]
MQLQNDLLLRAAAGQETERIPVWLMRQAGRILPEYRAVREQARGFKELVTNPELAAEVTIQPVDILGVDAAIIFSDILVIPEAMGLSYTMEEKKGPAFAEIIKKAGDVDKLRIADAEADLGYVTDAIKLVKRDLNGRVPLIGFAGAPWTIFSYMTEGGGSKTFSTAKKMLYADPELSHKLLNKITLSTIAYLKAQVAAGADLIQIFDSWAGILSPEQYRTFSIPYIKAICEAISEVPVTVFAKGAFFARKDLAALPCRVIGLDWNMDAEESRAIIGPGKTLQGNLDPCVLYGSFNTIRQETKNMLDAFGPKAYIANLGHGIYPDIHPDAVRCFIDTVKEYRPLPVEI